MKTRMTGMLTMLAVAAGLAWLAPTPVAAQAKNKYKAPRADDGKSPNLQGIWIVDAWDTSRYGLEFHGAGTGIRPGKGSITSPADGMIPYTPEARAKQQANLANHVKLDPMNRCFMTGVPRFVTSGFPFQIFQPNNAGPKDIIMASEYTHMIRYIRTERKDHIYEDLDQWLGESVGHWEGETLVVDTRSQLPDTWLDMSGSPHSNKMKVIERFTRTGDATMDYTATITDPEMLTGPFTISLTLHRNTGKFAQLMEYECNVYSEEDAKAGQ